MARREVLTEAAVTAVAALLFDRKFGVPWGRIADPVTRRSWRAAACRLLGVDVAAYADEPRATEPAPMCSCKGVVDDVARCDGACAVIPGFEHRARLRPATTSQKGEPEHPHAANFREAMKRIDELPSEDRSAMHNRSPKGEPSDG